MKRMEIGVGGVKRKNEIEILVEIKEWENKKKKEKINGKRMNKE